jgi:hypothetical protein
MEEESKKLDYIKTIIVAVTCLYLGGLWYVNEMKENDAILAKQKEEVAYNKRKLTLEVLKVMYFL